MAFKRVGILALTSWFSLASVSCQPTAPATLWNYRLEFVLHFDKTRHAQVWVSLPRTIPGRQEILSRNYSLRPMAVITRAEDSAAAFQFYNAPDSLTLWIDGVVRLIDADSHGFSEIPDKDWQSLFPAPPPSIWPDEIPLPILPQNPSMDTLEGLTAALLHYADTPGDIPWPQALIAGRGDCGEFADLLAQLCRQHGYQSRRVEGISGPGIGNLFHAWTECGDTTGWHRLDATRRHNHGKKIVQTGYLEIPNLAAWPEFQGLRGISVVSRGYPVRVLSRARFTPFAE